MAVRITDKSGKAASLSLRWKMNLFQLAASIQRRTPSRTNRLRSGYRAQRGTGIEINAKGDGVTIRNADETARRYARVIDKGFVIRSREAVRAKVMRFVARDGTVIYRRSVGPSRIPAQGNVRAGVNDWFGNKENIKLNWTTGRQ